MFAILLFVACSGGGKPGAELPDTKMQTWKIRSGAVGSIKLGQPLPDVLRTADLERHYIAGFIADAQPFEGFRYDSPPLTVGIANGPFIASGGELPLERCRSPAAAAARKGATVTTIRVHGRGPTTELGLGVGSTIAELRAAYADLSYSAVPPTLGGDECVATSPTLIGVYFLFASCAQAEAGIGVTRIDLWFDDSEVSMQSSLP